eukprot:ANDGO_05304.mRNA.1 Vacuolar protein-sorting-associated protein 33 homolog
MSANYLPNLSKACINLVALRDTARSDLITVLDSVRGGKVLVLDPQLIGTLSLVAEASLLKEHGVEKIMLLSASHIEGVEANKNVVYIVRAAIPNMRSIATQIHLTEASVSLKYHVFLIPRRSLICERVLEDLGVLDSIQQIGEMQLDLIAFDDDVLSMEMESGFRDMALDGDKTTLYYVTRSIMKLQAVFGVIPTVMGKGSQAKFVSEMMKRMHKELEIDSLNVNPEIDGIFLIDRDVDLFTPMLTQLTYEGLVDEIFGIKNGFVEVELEVKEQPKDKQAQPAAASASTDTPAEQTRSLLQKTKVPLNNSNSLYSEIRDLSFTQVGPTLNKKAVYIDENYKERHQAKTVSEIREFMKKLPNLQEEHRALGIHINIAEKISKIVRDSSFRRHIEAEQSIIAGESEKENLEYIEEIINRQEPLGKVLRLLCLFSIVNNGLKQKQYELFRREIMQTYGFETILTLHNLEKSGLLKRSESKPYFGALRKSMRLVDDKEDSGDISYTFAGYAPLSIRIIQSALRGQLGALEETLKVLPGPQFAFQQDLPAGVRPVSQMPDLSGTMQSRKKVLLVYFIGGVSFAEIAALRLIARQDDSSYDIIVASTKLINGSSLLESVYERVGLLAGQ